MTSEVSEKNLHISVLPNECMKELAPAFEIDSDPILMDGTLGGAGHTSLFLKNFPKLKVLAFDLDIHAIEAAQKKYATEVDAKKLQFHRGNFTDSIKMSDQWNAILLDLGYSSNQLEKAEYGMSFSKDSQLDMRLTRPPQGMTAWELLCNSSEKELHEIFEAYGEITGARKLAFKIKEAIVNKTITNSSNSLAKFVEKNSFRKDKIHPATLVFQALRIAINDELRNLDLFLKGILSNLKPKGRIAIISFHSLEDRIVKRWGQAHTAHVKAITAKPIVATDEEIRFNPRSRSAKLRVYERTLL